MAEPRLYPRYAERPLREALEDSPVVLIHGPRQSGKTTLAQIVCSPDALARRGKPLQWRAPPLTVAGAKSRGYQYLSFDDEVVRGGAEADPMGFVYDLPERVILDEVQRVPALFSALKMEVDRHRTPGRFVLAGSTNVLLVPQLADSLAGRMQVVRLHPLAQCELAAESLQPGELPRPLARKEASAIPPSPAAGRPDGFLGALFGAGFKMARAERLGGQLAERIVAGGFPAALARPSGPRRANWYRDYIDALVQRDVRDLSRIRALDLMPRVLALAAGQSARLLNISELASPFQVSRPTIHDYVALLERTFLLERLLPWHSNRLSRLVKTPKLHMGDTGLACALLGVDAKTLANGRELLGQLAETFAYQELRRQADWLETPSRFFHYRDKDKVEVDIVIERGASVAGAEVKAGATVKDSDFRGLRKLAKATGERFAGGVVLYDGETCVSFGERLYAVPLRLLWETRPQVGEAD